VPRRLLSKMPRDVVFAFSMLLICLIAMFMTGSRQGSTISHDAAVAFWRFFTGPPPVERFIDRGPVGGAVTLVLLQILGSGVSSRFDERGLVDVGRVETYRSTLRMIAEHPWFGVGLGLSSGVIQPTEARYVTVGNLGSGPQYAT